MEEITDARRVAIVETIRKIEIDELKTLGEKLFQYPDHPWHDKFFTFVSENEGNPFYHATTDDNIHVIYCHKQDRGMWFMPAIGMGPLQPNGLKILKQIVEEKF